MEWQTQKDRFKSSPNIFDTAFLDTTLYARQEMNRRIAKRIISIRDQMWEEINDIIESAEDEIARAQR